MTDPASLSQVPFPDEPASRGVVVVAYRRDWAREGAALAAALAELVPEALSIDHIGSTSVPGLPAKDCIDLMVQVRDLDAFGGGAALEERGYRRRPEPWNQAEVSYGVWHPKQVYAGPVGSRPCNVHVRQCRGLNVLYVLLFRDYLRGESDVAAGWGRFKLAVAARVPDLIGYGQLKAPAQDILMLAADK